MILNIGVNKILWVLLAILTLIVSSIGILDTGIYAKVVSKDLIPGAFSQDLQSLVASIVLLVLSLITKEKHSKKQIVILGILGYIFYAYGIYVIERAYNMYYLLYMAIFTLSFWAIVYGLANLKRDIFNKAQLPGKLKNISAAGALLQPLIFYPLWVGMLLNLMKTGNQIDSLYSIYILDLCFIMPAFAILAFYTFKNKGLGLLLLPAMYILGFTLIFSLAVGEIVKPFFQMVPKTDALIQALGLSSLFLILSILHLWKLKIYK